MRRPINKSMSRCAVVFGIAVLLATAARAGGITTNGPALPDLPGTTTAAAPPAAKPAAVKKKHAARPRGEMPTDTVTIDLPPSDDVYPDRPGAVVVDRNCLSCHSPEVVANQPQLTRAQWAAEVTKMREAFKAPIADDDEQTILDYLVSLRGEARTKYR
jgi:hypothetical protein